MDFLHHFLEGLYNDREAKLSAIAKHSYNMALSPHHPWLIRQGAKIAMVAVPSRDNFLKAIKATYE